LLLYIYGHLAGSAPKADKLLGLWLLSLVPFATLLSLMILLKWPSARAGAASWFVAALVAYVFFGADINIIGLASCKGLLLGIYVSYIIWSGVLLYNLAEDTGAIAEMTAGFRALTGDELLQVLLIGWTFVSFIQGIAGFAVPVAVVGPMLTSLGIPPMAAASIALLGHSWAVTFGSMATSFLTLALVTGLPPLGLALWSAVLLGIACIATGFLVSYMYGGFKALVHGLPAVTIIGGAMALTQYLLADLQSYVIASTGAGLVGCGVVGLLSRMPRFRRKEGAGVERGKFLLAFAPYLALVLLSPVVSLGPISGFLSPLISLSLPFPETRTSLGWVNPAVKSYSAINLLTHPGTIVLEAALIGYLVFRRRAMTRRGIAARVLRNTANQCLFPTMATLSMVMTALVMNESGMTYMLAEGVAKGAGSFYPIISAFIGIIGCFATGSNSASNAMFGAFQRDTARLLGVSEYVLCASQTTGGALGSMIAPAKVVVGTSVTKGTGQEGEVIHRTMPYCLALGLITSLAAWLIILILRG
jgi:lactate permease